MSLSIIIFDTKPKLVEDFRRNIAETIGNDAVYEIIAIDNTVNPRSISQVYNDGGRKAKYDNLLFLHQDAGFITKDWYKQIEEKLRERDCGVIGFAGTKVFFNYPAGWAFTGHEWLVAHYNDGEVVDLNRPEGEDFAEVVVVDGFVMFVRKDVWEKRPFDEKAVTGFHCYDIDFCLSLLPEYKNYVCCSVLPYHLSKGNFDEKWVQQTIKLYNSKWKYILPRYASDVRLSPAEAKNKEERGCFRAIRMLYKSGVKLPLINKHFLKYPLTARHFEHLIKFSSYHLSDLFKNYVRKKKK